MKCEWRIVAFCIAVAILANQISLTPSTHAVRYINEVPGGVEAKPIKQEKPNYPDKAENNGVEGWILLSFTVEADGSTSNTVILDQSVPGYFEKEVLRVVKKWVYEPATLMGTPVIQSQRRVLFSFNFGKWSDKASKNFITRYDNTIAALGKGDLIEAENQIREIESLKRRNMYETKYLFALKSELAQKKGNILEAAQHLQRALSFGEAPIEDESVWIMGTTTLLS